MAFLVVGQVEVVIIEGVQITNGILPGINSTVTIGPRMNGRWQFWDCVRIQIVNKKR